MAWLNVLSGNPILLRLWNRWFGKNRRRVYGLHNCIRIGASRLTQTQIQIQGNNNTVRIGNGCRLHDLKILMTGDSLHVEISDHCRLRGKIKLEDVGSQVVLGVGTTMENAYLGAFEGLRVELGNDCMLSDQVGLRTSDMHSIMDAASGRRINPAKSIILEPHVWVCRGATVLKGCTIGSGSVVGGYAVVTSSLPPATLAAGIPATVVRTNVRWSRERLKENSGS